MLHDKPFIYQLIKLPIRKILNLFKNGKLNEANKLRKAIKKEIRKSARSYYKNKVKELFTNTPKNWYSEVKKLFGRSLDQLDFNLLYPQKLLLITLTSSLLLSSRAFFPLHISVSDQKKNWESTKNQRLSFRYPVSSY